MKILSGLLAMLALTACAPTAQDPKIVAQEYWQALVDKDLETAQQLVSSDSQNLFDAYVQAVNTPQALQQVALDDQRTTVTTTINPDLKKPYRDRPFETVMVLEEGQWKIDLKDSRVPPAATPLEQTLDDMTNDMPGALEENLESMDNLLDEGMQLLDESLQRGSKEMSQSFREAMEQMREAMNKSIEEMKRRRDELQQQPSEKPAAPDSGEGVI